MTIIFQRATLFLAILFSLSLLGILGCNFPKSPTKGEPSLCGNGIFDKGEDCDVDVFDYHDTCINFGFEGGLLFCNRDCTINTNSCFFYMKCGDGIIQTHYGEDCDGENLGSNSCISLGYSGGELRCKSNCRFETLHCYQCGNGILDPFEICDGTNLRNMNCSSLGYFSDFPLFCDDNCEFAGCDEFPFISAGNGHVCWISVNGQAFCWGNNNFGELGNGKTSQSSTPVKVAANYKFSSISAGALQTCGITIGGKAYCWGRTSYGQIIG